MKIYFIERNDGLVYHDYQEGGNPPKDDQLRRREIAAETHGGSPDDWKGRMIEADLKPTHYIKSIEPDEKDGYVVNQEVRPEPPPPGPTLEDRVRALEVKTGIISEG